MDPPEGNLDFSESDSDDADVLDAEREGLLGLDAIQAPRTHSKTEFHPATVSSTALAAASNYYLERGSSAPDEEDVFGARLERQVFGIGDQVESSLGLTSGRGRRGRQRGRRPAARLAPELEPLLAKAHLCFLENKLDEALQACHEVIVKDPKAVPAYKTLSLIHGLRDESNKALDYALIAAHLNPLDAGWWKQIAAESVRVGKPRQAIHCLSKALRAARGHDMDALRERAYLYLQIGDDKRASAGFEQLLKLEPQNQDAVVSWARILLRRGEAATAESLLSNWLDAAARRERVRAGNRSWSNGRIAVAETRFPRAVQQAQGSSPLVAATSDVRFCGDHAETGERRPLLAHVRVHEALADAQLVQGKAAEVAAAMSRLALLLTAARMVRKPSPDARVSNPAAVVARTSSRAETESVVHSFCASLQSDEGSNPGLALPLRLRARLALAHLLLGDPQPARRIGTLLLSEEQVPFLYFHDLLYHFQQILARSAEIDLEVAILERLVVRPPYDQDEQLCRRLSSLRSARQAESVELAKANRTLVRCDQSTRANASAQKSSAESTLADTDAVPEHKSSLEQSYRPIRRRKTAQVPETTRRKRSRMNGTCTRQHDQEAASSVPLTPTERRRSARLR